MLNSQQEDDFRAVFNTVQRHAHETAVSKGFWEDNRSDGESIALIHSELSEALEALRHGNPPDDKIPAFTGAEAELADVIIRIMDLAGKNKWDVASALIYKMSFNKERPYKHGKTF